MDVWTDERLTLIHQLMNRPAPPFPHAPTLPLLLFLLSSILPLLHASPAQAQSVRLHVSADSVSVGERFTVSLVATHRFSSTPLFPAADGGSEVFGDLDVIRRADPQHRDLDTDEPGMRVDSVAYEVTTFALDTARVPALPVRFAAEGDTTTAATNPKLIPVRSTVPPDAQGLRDLAPLATFPGPLWPWLLLILAGLVILGGLAYYWRQRRSSDDASERDAAPAPPPTPPIEEARQRLQKLRQTNLESLDDPTPFYVELADLLRTYLARRLSVPALERTTAELLSALRRHPQVPDQAIAAVQSALEQADLVKFADARPNPPDHRAALDAAETALDRVESALRAETEDAASAPPTS